MRPLLPSKGTFRGVLAALSLAGLVGVILGAACTQTDVRSQEGGPCSVSSGDNPLYTCDPSKELICVNSTLDGKYYCRMACDVGDRVCQPGEVCCAGKIHGQSYGKSGGCTIPAKCELRIDAGTAD